MRLLLDGCGRARDRDGFMTGIDASIPNVGEIYHTDRI